MNWRVCEETHPADGTECRVKCSDGLVRFAIATDMMGMQGWLVDGLNDFAKGRNHAYRITHWKPVAV